MEQRLTEWDLASMKEHRRNYFINQFHEVKRSTVHFMKFIENDLKESKRIIDLGCGMGASTYFMAQQFKEVQFIGIDIMSDFIEEGKKILKSIGHKVNNLEFIVDDWFNLSDYDNIDGVFSLQTLSWLPEYKSPLENIFLHIKSPQWIALSSLFYEGEISAFTEITEHETGTRTFYNTYSIKEIQKYCEKFGYTIVESKPFEIDIDLIAPVNINKMSTYTVKTENDKRLQISGPLLMNWYFLKIAPC